VENGWCNRHDIFTLSCKSSLHIFCFPDSSARHVDESDQEYRSRVEQIRQLGGDKWLTMLGEIKTEDSQVSKQTITCLNPLKHK